MKLLLIGGTGALGSMLRPALEAQHTCYYLEAQPVPGAEARTFVGHLDDEGVLKKAVHGMDRLIWLGTGYDRESNSKIEEAGHTGDYIADANLFDDNVKGLYRLLHIAQFSGVLRFIYASSMSVYANYDNRDRHPLHELIPTDAWNPSGLSRRLGEAVGQACVRNRPECTFLSLRLMLPPLGTESTDNVRSTARRYFPLGPNDTCRLFLAATSFDRLGYYALQATGDMEGKSFPNTRAAAVLGWRPQGD